MMNSLEVYYPIICGTVAADASVASGLWLTKKYRLLGREVLRLGLAVSAGFLLAAVLLEIIPESIVEWSGRGDGLHHAMALVMIGYLAMIFLERAIAPNIHIHFEATLEPYDHSHSQELPAQDHHHDHHLFEEDQLPALLSALLLHAFFDGVSIASGFLVSRKLGWIIFIALLLHKIPDGATIVSVVLAAGRSRRVAQIAAICTGLATLAGAIAMIFIQPRVPIVAYALPIAAGVTLHVAASDLVPEITGGHRGLRTPLAILTGVILFYLTHLWLEVVQS